MERPVVLFDYANNNNNNNNKLITNNKIYLGERYIVRLLRSISLHTIGVLAGPKVKIHLFQRQTCGAKVAIGGSEIRLHDHTTPVVCHVAPPLCITTSEEWATKTKNM